jgi:hypothetical protein
MQEERVREFKTELQRVCENFGIHIVGACCGRVILYDAGRICSTTQTEPRILISNSIMAMENEDEKDHTVETPDTPKKS